MNLENDKSTKNIADIFDLDDPEEKDLQSFFNGLRRVSSSSQQKIDFMFDFMNSVFNKRVNKKLGITTQMLESHTDKFIIFTHFKTHGSTIITNRLKKEGTPFGFIDGTVSKAKRSEVVDQYVAGKIRVILISAAGATGLNLLETGFMFLVEPSWNESEVIQVVARANRFMSHTNLPKKKRNVLVMKLLLIKPEERKHISKLITDKTKYQSLGFNPSIDVKMLVDSGRKQLQIVKHLAMLETKVMSLEQCARNPKSIPSELSTFRVLTKFSDIPRLTAAETKLITSSARGVIHSVPSRKSITQSIANELSQTPNTGLVKNILSACGITKINKPIVILFDTPSHVLPFHFLNANSSVYVNMFLPRLSPSAKKLVSQLPRTLFTSSSNVKPYKIAILNYYVNLATGIPIGGVSIVKMITWLINVRSSCDITFLMVGSDVFETFKFKKFMRNKQFDSIKYTSPFHKIEHGSKGVEMYLLKFSNV